MSSDLTHSINVNGNGQVRAPRQSIFMRAIAGGRRLMSKVKAGKGTASAAVTSAAAAAAASAQLPAIKAAMHPALAHPLPSYSPWRWLLTTCFIMLLYIAADVVSAVTVPLPALSGSDVDYFTTIGWLLHLIGLLILAVAAVIIIVKRHPFYRSLLIAYFVALALLVAAAVLHSARLNRSPLEVLLNEEGEGNVLAVQLTWLANICLYALLTRLVWRSGVPTMRLPTYKDRQRYQHLTIIREMEVQRMEMVQEMEQMMVKQKSDKQEATAVENAEAEAALPMWTKRQPSAAQMQPNASPTSKSDSGSG